MVSCIYNTTHSYLWKMITDITTIASMATAPIVTPAEIGIKLL